MWYNQDKGNVIQLSYCVAGRCKVLVIPYRLFLFILLPLCLAARRLLFFCCLFCLFKPVAAVIFTRLIFVFCSPLTLIFCFHFCRAGSQYICHNYHLVSFYFHYITFFGCCQGLVILTIPRQPLFLCRFYHLFGGLSSALEMFFSVFLLVLNKNEKLYMLVYACAIFTNFKFFVFFLNSLDFCHLIWYNVFKQ